MHQRSAVIVDDEPGTTTGHAFPAPFEHLHPGAYVHKPADAGRLLATLDELTRDLAR